MYIPCYSQGVREAILKKLDKMKEANFIELSISPFAAPMVCVRKGDSSLRVTTDFQMINKSVIEKTYPLHWIDDQIDSMRGSAWYIILYLTKGYHQMNLDTGSREFKAATMPIDYINGKSCLLVWRIPGFLSTIDGFSFGGPSAENFYSIYQQHIYFSPYARTAFWRCKSRFLKNKRSQFES